MSFLKGKAHLYDSQISEEQQDNFEIKFSENKKVFQGSFLVKQEMLSKFKNLKLDLKKEKIFKIPFSLNILKRKNNIFYFVSTKEMHVDIKDNKGSVFYPLSIEKRLEKTL